MDTTAVNPISELKPELDKNGKRIIVTALSFSIVNLTVMLLAAGTLQWWNAWAMCALTLCSQMVLLLILVKKDPELINERGKFVKKDTKGFDKIFLRTYIPMMYISLIVAAIDHKCVRAERQNFDPAGHYARPDVTQLTVNRQRQSKLTIIE